jgi:hypothetical protein
MLRGRKSSLSRASRRCSFVVLSEVEAPLVAPKHIALPKTASRQLLTETEHMFYTIDKRHTGGWCGPGQRLSASVMCQSISTGQVSDLPTRQIPLLPPAPADQGPGVELVASYQLLVTKYSSNVFRGRPHRRNPSAVRIVFERVTVFELPRAPNAHSASQSCNSPFLPALRAQGRDVVPCRVGGMSEKTLPMTPS